MYIPEWCPGQRGECTWSFLHDQSLSLASPSVAPSCRNGPQEWLEQSLVSVQHPPHPIHSRGNSTAPYISIPTPFSTSHYAEVSKRRKLVCQECFANEVHFGVRHPHTGLLVLRYLWSGGLLITETLPFTVHADQGVQKRRSRAKTAQTSP